MHVDLLQLISFLDTAETGHKHVNTYNAAATALEGGLNQGKINPKGYVAVELYNPYSTELVLTDWTLGVVDRRSATPPGGTT